MFLNYQDRHSRQLKGLVSNFDEEKTLKFAADLETRGRECDFDGADLLCEELVQQVKRLIGVLESYIANH